MSKPTITPRRPKRVDSVEARRFLGSTVTDEAENLGEQIGLEDAPVVPKMQQGSGPATERTSTKAPARAVVKRRDGRELRQVAVYLPAVVAKRLAHFCVDQERDRSEIVTDAVTLYMDSKKQ